MGRHPASSVDSSALLILRVVEFRTPYGQTNEINVGNLMEANVILSAAAIGIPKVLELSGVWNRRNYFHLVLFQPFTKRILRNACSICQLLVKIARSVSSFFIYIQSSFQHSISFDR